MEEKYKEAAQENRLRIFRVKATRGVIYDRTGSPLAANFPSLGLSFMPASLKGIYPSVEGVLKGDS